MVLFLYNREKIGSFDISDAQGAQKLHFLT